MIPALCIAGALLFSGGVGVGVAVSRSKTERILAEQTQLIGTIQDGQRELAATVGAPVVIDAEVRASLAQIPPACVEALGGDARSAECLLLSCWSMGQSSAQRPSCDKVESLVMERHEVD